MSPEPQTFGTLAVSRIAGVTLRQLQWWAETGVVVPVIVKNQRQYSHGDLLQVFLLAELLAKGFTFQETRRICRALAKQQEHAIIPHRWMLTNGNRVLLLSGEVEVIAFLEQKRAPVYAVVALDKLRTRMRQRIAACAVIQRKPAARALEFAALMRQALSA